MTLVRTTGYVRQRMGDVEPFDLIINTDHIGHIQPTQLSDQVVLLVTMDYGAEFFVDQTFLEKNDHGRT